MCWTAQSTDCPGGLGGSLLSRTNQHTDVSSAAVPGGAASSAAVPGGAASSTTSPGETVFQSPVTVEVAPMTGVQPETPGEAETGKPPYKAARSGDIVMVIDGETLCVPEEDVPKVYYEEDDGQVLPTEQVHEGMQRELQLMRDLEVSERVLCSDVSPGKKIWSTKWCHRRKGTGVRSRFVVRQFRDTDWETAFSGVPGLVVVRILLCASIILETSIVPGDLVAFMSTPLHDAEYIEPPLEAESDKQYVWKSRKALNGLKKADLRTAIHVDEPLIVGEIDTVMRFYDSLKQWLLVRVQDVVGSMKSSIYLGCRYWRLGHCFVEAATEHYHEDALARVGMTSCKSVVTPGVKRGAPAPESREARLLSIEARLTFEGCYFPSRRGVRETRCFLTHFASVDCVNSDSCSEVTIQSCHVFFCAITVVFSAFQ